jgi:PAS domain S-box-containing protein
MVEKSKAGHPGEMKRMDLEADASGKQSIQNIDQSDVLQKIIDKIPVAIFLINPRGFIQLLNRDAKSLIGELTASNGFGVWPGNFEFFLDDGKTPYPKDSLPVNRSLQGETTHNEELILRRNGEKKNIWISMSSQPLSSSGDGSGGVIILIRDITYRKEIELSREKHIRRTETLYKLSKIITDTGNDLVSTAQALAKFISEVIGDLGIVMLKNHDDTSMKIVAFHNADHDRHTFMRKLFVDNNGLELESGIVGGVIKTGEPLFMPSVESEYIEVMNFPLFKEYVQKFGLESLLIVPLTGRGGVLGALSISCHRENRHLTQDDQSLLMDIALRGALAIENCILFESLREQIAEHLSTKGELAFSEQRFRAIFDSTLLGIKLLDVDGNIQRTNPAFRRIVGYSETELEGKNFTEFLRKSDVSRALKLIEALKSRGTTQYFFEHRALHKDGSSVWIKTAFSPVMKEDGSKHLVYIVGIVEDISEHKQAEAEMNELNDRLQHNIELERLRLAQELHDNPMQALYSVVFQLERIRATTHESLKGELKGAVEEIKIVIDSLRSTAKELRPPTISEFGLENAIRSHVDDILEKHPHLKISLSLAQDRQLLREGTRLALFRVFQQAMMNVVRHSGATRVKVRFMFDATQIRLEISDNGKGFDVPSNWVAYVRKGHFGLAGAAERISMLGGYLKVSSAPGNSTTIVAVIPFEESEMNPGNVDSLITSERDGKNA